MAMAERQHTEHAPKKGSKGAKAQEAGDLIAVAAGALVLREMFGGGAAPIASSGRVASPQRAPTKAPAGGILRGLSDLISKLTAGGVGPQVNSWVGPGQNQTIQPGQLGSALGQNTLNELSQRTGMSQQELLNQLATVLPQLINHLTPYGRMPTVFDLEKDDAATISTFEAAMAASRPGSYFEDVFTLLGGSKILGSTIHSELDAHELLQRGLPRVALSKLVDNLHVIQVDEATEALGMSVRTLQRHKNTPVVRLDVQQSGRTWKFAEVLAKATRVLGSQDEAEQWLRRPAIGLDQKRPIDLLTTPAGVQLVEDYLGRLEYNVYT
jgi:putative toxin-antitoxin system antitoxin component (TIGR02293 family)